MITSSQMMRLRRQMYRRIREVVAERRMARLDDPARLDREHGLVTVERDSDDRSLVAG
ncbi:MAG TPA: hypothetical protein VF174_00820 [Micromonosporaceae bacterium]